MSYLVFCTFDLKNASAQDYQNAYSDLAQLGLGKVHVNSQGGKDVIPTTAAMGFLNGSSSSNVCEQTRNNIQAKFRARGLTSELFITTGDNWAWVAGTT